MRKIILLLLAASVLVLAGFVVNSLYNYPKAQIAAATRQAAPDFTLSDATGAPFHLADQHGHKVVLYFYRGYW